MNSEFLTRLKNGIVPLMILVMLFLASSCKKNNADPTGVTNEGINRWIVDSMRYYYYWNTGIPENNNLNFNQQPTHFFESLLKRPTDRFSWIQNAKELRDQLSGVIKTSGLGFSFFRIGDNGAGVTVRYVYKGSPAAQAGIKRGDIFTRVNGVALTVNADGYVQNHQPLQGNATFTITKGILNDGVISEGDEISLTPVEGFQESAIHLDSVITTQNGTKVAFLFYNRFLNQPQELVNAFKKFKAANVTELIVDERYNGGGSVGIAGLLSALIHQGFQISSPFIQYKFNSNFRDETLTYADMIGAANEALVNANNLGLSRVFILATDGSASASELLINNLKPFLGATNVIHIGSKTYGKDEASITIENSSSRYQDENDWGIQPIVLKYKNKDGEGDFEAGLTPTHQVSETVPFAPMGSQDDPLVAKALGVIDPGMVASLNKQMSVNRVRQPAGIRLLDEFNKELSNPRPLDVTESLKGRNLQKLQ